MYFNSVFYIFGITLVLVQCRLQGGRDYHEYKTVNCHDVRKEMGETLRMSVAQPRDMSVDLIPGPGQSFVPRTVYIPKCTGVCRYGTTLVPTKTKRRIVPIAVNSASRFGIQCATVELEEHIKCRCECTKNPRDCDQETQFWDPKTCSCKCKNEEQRMRLCKSNMFWNADTCSCECTYGNGVCASSWRWSKETCMCVKDEDYN